MEQVLQVYCRPYDARNLVICMDEQPKQLINQVRSPVVVQPGKPQQNAYIERYSRTVRYDWSAHYLFDSIKEVQDCATRWLWTYNYEHANVAISGVIPKRKMALAA